MLIQISSQRYVFRLLDVQDCPWQGEDHFKLSHLSNNLGHPRLSMACSVWVGITNPRFKLSHLSQKEKTTYFTPLLGQKKFRKRGNKDGAVSMF